jgi:hypothetical protein
VKIHLSPQTTKDAKVEKLTENHWRLHIPAGQAGEYRLAQLDDYGGKKRREMPWQPPLTIEIEARASGENLLGTWGFGLWNDPFSLSLGLGGAVRKFPALPNAAWFFFASPPNYLSFRDDLPAAGQLAATFRSSHFPALLLAPAGIAAPLLLVRPVARLLRRLARVLIQQSAAQMGLSAVEWHRYQIEWQQDRTVFKVDDQILLDTSTSPKGPLGLVLWIDNQYAALPPDGKLGYGALENQKCWIEVKNLEIN